MSGPDAARFESSNSLVFDRNALRMYARAHRWDVGLLIVAWLHLSIFLVCWQLFLAGSRSQPTFVSLWILDIGLTIETMRRFSALRSEGPESPIRKFIVRVWVTFALICFSSVSLNKITGFEIDWFKVAWASLSTFSFAMLAWVVHIRFLIPAFAMAFAGLLIARLPDQAYLIYGVSWWIVLHGIAWKIRGGKRDPRRSDAALSSVRPALPSRRPPIEISLESRT